MKDKLKKIEKILENAFNDGRDTLFEHEVYDILSIYDIDVPEYILLKTENDAKTCNPLRLKSSIIVAKIVSPDVLHKTDAGGVLFLYDIEEGIESSFNQIKENIEKNVPDARFCGVLLSEVIEYDRKFTNELIISFKQDRSFGPLITFGQGGIYTEFFAKQMKDYKSVATRSAYLLDKHGIKDMINQTAIAPALYGKMRGDKHARVEEETLLRFIEFMKDISEYFSPLNTNSKYTIEEFELNPVIVSREKKLIAVDGLVKFTDKKHKTYNKPVNKINNLLKPKTAVVLGASANKMNPGRIILQNLINGGGVSKSNTFVIHHKAETIDGCKCIKSIHDIPECVDIAVITIPADKGAGDSVIELIKERKAHSIILITSGFGETEAGKVKEKEMKAEIIKSRSNDDGGILVNGGNCLGIVSHPGQYNTFFLPKYKLPFNESKTENVAMISQSGAYLVALASNFDRYISPRYTISFGNQMDLTVSDFLEYMKDDDKIDVITTYVEGFQDLDGVKYINTAKEIIKSGKVILLYKAGRTNEGMKAAASHTASMVGDYASTVEVMRQIGVITIDDLDMLEDYIMAFSFLSKKSVSGNRVGIISNAGFECTRSADSLYDMELAEFKTDTMDKIKSILPSDIVDIHNPIDATPTADTDSFVKTVEAMMEDDNTDCVVVSAVGPTPALENINYGKGEKTIEDVNRDTSLPNRLIQVFEKYKKPMIVCVDSGKLYDEGVHLLKLAGVPCFRKIDRATRAMSAFVNYHLNK